jgi:hypothetical protein
METYAIKMRSKLSRKTSQVLPINNVNSPQTNTNWESSNSIMRGTLDNQMASKIAFPTTIKIKNNRDLVGT